MSNLIVFNCPSLCTLLKKEGIAFKRAKSQKSFALLRLSVYDEEEEAALSFLSSSSYPFFVIKTELEEMDLSARECAFLKTLVQSDSIKDFCFRYNCQKNVFYREKKKVLQKVGLTTLEQLRFWAIMNYWA